MATFRLIDVYNLTGIGLVPVGKVEEGIIRIGMKANLEGSIIEIKEIEMHHEKINEAKAGDNVGISVNVSSEKPAPEKRGILNALFGNKRGNSKSILEKYKGRIIEFN